MTKVVTLNIAPLFEERSGCLLNTQPIASIIKPTILIIRCAPIKKKYNLILLGGGLISLAEALLFDFYLVLLLFINPLTHPTRRNKKVKRG